MYILFAAVSARQPSLFEGVRSSRLAMQIECDGSDPIHSGTCRLLIKWSLKVGAPNRMQRFGSDLSRHV